MQSQLTAIIKTLRILYRLITFSSLNNAAILSLNHIVLILCIYIHFSLKHFFSCTFIYRTLRKSANLCNILPLIYVYLLVSKQYFSRLWGMGFSDAIFTHTIQSAAYYFDFFSSSPCCRLFTGTAFYKSQL